MDVSETDEIILRTRETIGRLQAVRENLSAYLSELETELEKEREVT